MPRSNPPGLPAELSRPDAQAIVDALNLRLHSQEGKFPVEEIKEGAVGPTEIENEAITTPKLHAEAVTAAKIEAGTITATQLHANAVTAEKIEAGAITTEKIEAGAVTATKLSVSELSAITSNLGSVTAGTITGATIKTAGSGARVELTSSGIKGLNASGTTKFNFDTTTGILTATAVISAEEGSTIPTKVLSGQIKETQIENEAISTPLLKANAVTAAKLSVSELSAISANLGTIEAGTITSAKIRSSAAEETVLDSNGLRILGDNTKAKTEEQARRKLQWTSEGGKEIASVLSYIESSGQNTIIRSLSGSEYPATGGATVQVEAKNAGKMSAVLRLKANNLGEGGFYLLLNAMEKELLNEKEQSAFLQLTETAKRKINFGSGELTFAGGTVQASGSVTHGLGTTPVFATIIAEDAGYVPGTATYGATTFTAAIQRRDGTTPTAGTKAKFHWFAIG